MDNIDSMLAGRELDALIAEKVFGHTVVICDPTGFNYEDNIGPCLSDVPHDGWDEMLYVPYYSTDYSAAWEVVDLFRYGKHPKQSNGLDSVACVIEMIVTDYCGREDCICTIYSPSLEKAQAAADQMPLAICRAALKVVMESKQK